MVCVIAVGCSIRWIQGCICQIFTGGGSEFRLAMTDRATIAGMEFAKLVYCGIACEGRGVSPQSIPEFPLRHSSKFNKIKIHTHTLYFSTHCLHCLTLFLYTLFL